jgi:DNA-binding GntR family transcriptional regulator
MKRKLDTSAKPKTDSRLAASAPASNAPVKKQRSKIPLPAAEPIGSTVDQVYAQLESMIVTLELPPGALLSEAELGSRLGVSRTPIGEALQRLAREGLVTIFPRRGILVSEVSLSEQLQLLELRREISRFVARAGARRAKPDDRERMRRVADNFLKAAEANDDAGLLRADKEFHDLFVLCAYNTFASRAIVSMDSASRRFWYVHREADSQDTPRSARLHADIAIAVAEGNEEGAMRASDALADYLEIFARATLDRLS